MCLNRKISVLAGLGKTQDPIPKITKKAKRTGDVAPILQNKQNSPIFLSKHVHILELLILIIILLTC
jgi:hypothetical protein